MRFVLQLQRSSGQWRRAAAAAEGSGASAGASPTAATAQQKREFVEDAMHFLLQTAEFVRRRFADRPGVAGQDGWGHHQDLHEQPRHRRRRPEPDATLTARLRRGLSERSRGATAQRRRFVEHAAERAVFSLCRSNPGVGIPQLCAGAGSCKITGTVGLDANNAPADVRAVQQRLVELGYLALQEFVAERPAAQAGPTGRRQARWTWPGCRER